MQLLPLLLLHLSSRVQKVSQVKCRRTVCLLTRPDLGTLQQTSLTCSGSHFLLNRLIVRLKASLDEFSFLHSQRRAHHTKCLSSRESAILCRLAYLGLIASDPHPEEVHTQILQRRSNIQRNVHALLVSVAKMENLHVKDRHTLASSSICAAPSDQELGLVGESPDEVKHSKTCITRC